MMRRIQPLAAGGLGCYPAAVRAARMTGHVRAEPAIDEVGAPMKPVQGYTTLTMPVEALWERFVDVPNWPEWNACIRKARVECGVLHEGATLVWQFNPIKPWMPYVMPAKARIVEFVPYERVTWEVTVLPGFRARHSYIFERGAEDGVCRFGSWESARGPMYGAFRLFWNAHFRFVRDESLRGAERLAAEYSRE